MARRSTLPTLDVLLTGGRTIRFNRRHYEVLAAVFREIRRDSPDFDIGYVASRLADAFERDNPFFSRERFMDACQGGEA
jgi:hypothetical protein